MEQDDGVNKKKDFMAQPLRYTCQYAVLCVPFPLSKLDGDQLENL
jgi:hypothetical protein